MSKKVKYALGAVAAVAMPYMAPSIFGGLAGSIASGALSGGLLSKAGGGKFAQGALMGGALGGVGQALGAYGQTAQAAKGAADAGGVMAGLKGFATSPQGIGSLINAGAGYASERSAEEQYAKQQQAIQDQLDYERRQADYQNALRQTLGKEMVENAVDPGMYAEEAYKRTKTAGLQTAREQERKAPAMSANRADAMRRQSAIGAEQGAMVAAENARFGALGAQRADKAAGYAMMTSTAGTPDYSSLANLYGSRGDALRSGGANTAGLMTDVYNQYRDWSKQQEKSAGYKGAQFA